MSNKNFLEQEEVIIWEGKPHIKLFHVCDIVLIPFQIFLFGIFMLFIFDIIKLPNTSVTELTFGIILFFLSLYIIVGRTINKVITQSKTSYYLTNKRAVILKNTRKPSIKIKYYNSMKIIDYRIRNNGRSKVVFDFAPPLTPLYANSGRLGESFMSGASLYGQLPAAFYNLNPDDAEEVYDLACEYSKRERE